MNNIYANRPYMEYDPTIARLKKDVVARIQKARASGVSAGKIAAASDGMFSIGNVYDMLNAEVFDKGIWEKMDEVLKKVGY